MGDLEVKTWSVCNCLHVEVKIFDGQMEKKPSHWDSIRTRMNLFTANSAYFLWLLHANSLESIDLQWSQPV